MQYNSWLYLIPFLGGSVLCYYIVPLKYRWLVLLFTSLLFYILSSGWLILFVVCSAFTIYAAALEIEKEMTLFGQKKGSMDKGERKKCKKAVERKKRNLVLMTAAVNMGVLILLKYSNFLGQNLNQLFAYLGTGFQIPRMSFVIPLGISFYTLAAVSYVTDVGRGLCKAENNYFKVLLFLIFFPVITEGPIERYGGLGKQTGTGRDFDYKTFCFGCQLIVWGLFQKVVLADKVNRLVSYVFSHYYKYTGFPLLAGILLYTFQLYMDFSGCIDVARGSAQLFGIELTENFRRPFFSETISEFWRRWHISLGTWLKDYIFFPLSLSKGFQYIRKKCRSRLPEYYAGIVPGIMALFFVWMVNGIWHGAQWKYIVYGLYYYVIMVAGMLTEPFAALVCRKLSVDRQGKALHIFRKIRTFLLVNIGMLIFRAKDLPVAVEMLQRLFVPYQFKTDFFFWALNRGNLHKRDFLLIFGSILFLVFYGRFKEKGGQLREELAAKTLVVRWAVYMASVLFVVMMGAYGPGFGGDFMYANF